MKEDERAPRILSTKMDSRFPQRYLFHRILEMRLCSPENIKQCLWKSSLSFRRRYLLKNWEIDARPKVFQEFSNASRAQEPSALNEMSLKWSLRLCGTGAGQEKDDVAICYLPRYSIVPISLVYCTLRKSEGWKSWRRRISKAVLL